MPFPEDVKLEAKRRAHFRCVVCQQPWVEVHHIHPQAEQGADSLENAAPLCASCHQRFGGNPELRKQLREMRDQWWKRCANRSPDIAALFEKLDALLGDHAAGRAENRALMSEVKRLMKDHISQLQHTVSSASNATDIINAVVTFSTSVPPDADVKRPLANSLAADAIALLTHISSEGGSVNQHSESHSDVGLSRIRYEEAVSGLLEAQMIVRVTNTHHTHVYPELSLTSAGRRWAIEHGLA
jgi:hypothetical protein